MPAAAPALLTHVVGVGASAGGLEAMLPMFAQTQRTGHAAYVVAQHMARDGHDELLTRLIGRASTLPVQLAGDGIVLQPDNVYVIPSGRHGRVDGRHLRIDTAGGEHLSAPSVNALFRSLAVSQRERAIGVVLSGTGSDGTAGCRAIRAAGGLTLAQDPAEAKFDGMPTAAIEARAIDRVLPAAEIGPALAALFPDRPRALPAAAATPVDAPALAELALLLPQIAQATGIDFSSYKEDTLLRRLDKRKRDLGIGSAADYQALIRRRPDELHTLQQMFLVSVSSFFRDGEAFAALEQALARRCAERTGGDAAEALRVWVPGCAGGEEALSLAILLQEHGAGRTLEIVASDLNPEALTLARSGLYRAGEFREMSSARRERYFEARGEHYAVRRALQALVRYEQRDVLGGAPAGEFDLISCRNLLIYMKSGLQDRLVRSFCAALRPQGLLFIGQSESLGFVGDALFAPVDAYHRIYARRR